MIYLNNNKMFKRFYKMSDFFDDLHKVCYFQLNESIILFNDY